MEDYDIWEDYENVFPEGTTTPNDEAVAAQNVSCCVVR